jgi:hypothetical protein
MEGEEASKAAADVHSARIPSLKQVLGRAMRAKKKA